MLGNIPVFLAVLGLIIASGFLTAFFSYKWND